MCFLMVPYGRCRILHRKKPLPEESSFSEGLELCGLAFFQADFDSHLGIVCRTDWAGYRIAPVFPQSCMSIHAAAQFQRPLYHFFGAIQSTLAMTPLQITNPGLLGRFSQGLVKDRIFTWKHCVGMSTVACRFAQLQRIAQATIGRSFTSR